MDPTIVSHSTRAALKAPPVDCVPPEELAELVERLDCWLDVDLESVAHNVRVLRQWVGPATAVAAVVKAEAYGVGAEEVGRAALDAGAQRLAVARVHEAVQLRQQGIQAPILILSRTHPSEAREVVQYGLTATVDTRELAAALGSACAREGRRTTVHIKIDTGLHRFGVDPSQALPLARALAETQGVTVEGVWTHFASADQPDLSSTQEQIEVFERVVEDLATAGYRFPIRHAANSAATLTLPQSHLDLVRPGLTLYGVTPMSHAAPCPDLRPAVALRARIGRVTRVAAGETVGYGQTWRAERPTRIGLVLAGYAEGVPRRLSNKGSALVLGRRAPIIGRVSMDHTTFDITDVPQAEVGSVVVFFGQGGDGGPDLWEVAQQAQTIPHELLTQIGGSVPRVYRRGEQIVRVARLSGTVDLGPPPR